MRNKIEKIINNKKYIKDTNDPNYVRYNSFMFFFNTACYALLIANILTVYQKQYTSLPYIAILTLIMFLVKFALNKNIIKREKYDLLIIVFSSLLTIICPVIYLTSGGLYSSTLLWLMLITFFTCVVMRKNTRIIFFIAQVSILSLTIFLDYKKIVNPEGILSRREWFISSIAVMSTICLFLGIFLSYILYEYEKVLREKNHLLESAIEQKELAEELMSRYEEQKELAEEAMAVQNKFLASMSHELRTPLNVVYGLSDIINRIQDIEEIHTLTENIHDASKYLLTIMTDILDYQDIREGKIEIKEEPYKTDLLFRVLHGSVPDLEKKGLKWEIITDRIPEVLVGDPCRLQQILLNLISNAIKYTNEGSITYKIYYNYNSNILEMSVSDTGQGIKEDEINYIFSKFARGKLYKNTKISGIGLGLALVKKLVENMNGKIKVFSTYGGGSTFIVSIPQKLVQNENISKQLNKKNKTYDFSSIKALYIDDTPTNHLVLDRLLLDTKISITHKQNASDIFNINKEELLNFDVILLDYLMPGMDGIEVYKHLKALGVRVPCFIVTADVTKENRLNYKEQGFTGCITKPIEKQIICEELENILYPEAFKII